ncbi:MAG: cell division protein FtsQ/DivIB [Bacteroidota bacterium]|nr:cell division protein FtsQ/DivIB [Bacteroidota bacterium]
MNAKGTIRKILFIALWVSIGGGMLTLLIAAIGRQKKDHCKDFSIRIKGVKTNFSTGCYAFVDEQDVIKLLKAAAKGNIKGQPKSSFNLLQIEQELEKNTWIKDAELYFDNRDVLHVSVLEREPIARLFTITGKSFYIDETGKMIPLSEKISAKVPVFTGFPEKVISKRDSALLQDVKSTAGFILHDPFWMAQVAQVDITPDQNFEMMPVVGNHTVILGTGENIDRKFHRLFVFYKNILSQAGFNAYKTINVEYAGQVIGVRDKQASKADTARLRSNLEELLKQGSEVQSDSLIAEKAIKEQKEIKADPAIAATEKNTSAENVNEPAQAESNPNPVLVTNPVSMKPFSDPKKSEKPKDNPKSNNEKKEPKAVMKPPTLKGK